MSRSEEGPAAWKRLLKAWDHDDHACLSEKARAFTKKYPRHGGGWLVLGDVLTGCACYDEALAALRRGARLMGEKHRPRVWLYVGHAYQEKGNYRSAEHWYRRSVDADQTTREIVRALCPRRRP